jgi:dTDP-4-dehydrorhamnose 3,5-epimerase-like enzyme
VGCLGDATLCDGKVRLLAHAVIDDARGTLSPIDLAACGFVLARAFVVTARDGVARGAHGHLRGRQILIQVAGEVGLELIYRGRPERLTLTPERRAVLIEPPVWSRQTYRGDPAALVVLCDTAYDPEDYFTDPERAR